MSKISDIIISNFKFFSKKETIHLGGNHLLLYGENGSGKSSLFWGLYTLLEASFKAPLETEKYFLPLNKNEESLVNIYASIVPANGVTKEHSNSYIRIQDDNSNSFELSLLNNNICGDTNAQESRKASDFVNYQSIFKFQDFRNSEAPDLYNIFLYSIMPYVTFSSFTVKGKSLSNAGQMWSEYVKGPGYTYNKKGDKILVYKNSPQYKEFCNFEAHFNAEFTKLIDFININAKSRLKELGYDMDFQLTYGYPGHVKKDKNYEWYPFKTELEITRYNGKDVQIKKPHVFLNEARLSALATAIRLTILDYRLNKSTVPNALKVLILDDLMISLDMSNREALIDLLLKDYHNKYQILFLTHDKSLYDFVDYKIRQHKQDVLWVRKEMYVGEDDTTKHEIPVIIDGECDLFEKAQKYFSAKDYVASALFVRKSLEKVIGELLPIELIKKAEGGFVGLQTLWDKLIDFYSQNGKSIDSGIVRLFEDSKLLVLNPSAHYQRLSTPIYRNELKTAFFLYKEIVKLKRIERELVIEAGKVFEFNYPTANYYCVFKLMKDLVIIEGEHLISVMPKCSNIKWKYNDIDYYNFETGEQDLLNPLISATPKLNKFVDGLTKLPIGITEEIFLNNAMIDGSLLNEYLHGVKISSLILASAKV